MKTIPLRTFPELTSADVFRGVLENTPGNGGEMRKRFRVIDAIEAAQKDGATEVLLEDADYSTLRALTEAFQYTRITRDLLTVVDDVANAVAPAEPPKEA